MQLWDVAAFHCMFLLTDSSSFSLSLFITVCLMKEQLTVMQTLDLLSVITGSDLSFSMAATV